MCVKLKFKLRPRTKSVLLYLAEFSGFAVMFLGFYAYQTRNLLPTDYQLAPALHASSLDGAPVTNPLGDADVTLVYFFAPWCKVCAASSSNIKYLRSLRDTDDLNILLVALDWQSPAEVREYVDRHNIEVPVVLGDRQVANDWNIYAFPTYYILDEQLRIIRRDLGYSTLAGLWWRTFSWHATSSL